MTRPMLLATSMAAMLAIGSSKNASAQDFVPGGWSAEVVHQSLGPLSTVPQASGSGQGDYSPFGLYQPPLTGTTPYPNFVQAPTTANGLVPLGKVIQKSRPTKAKRSR